MVSLIRNAPPRLLVDLVSMELTHVLCSGFWAAAHQDKGDKLRNVCLPFDYLVSDSGETQYGGRDDRLVEQWMCYPRMGVRHGTIILRIMLHFKVHVTPNV